MELHIITQHKKENQFIYTFCNNGLESYLKEEVSIFFPKLSFAYSQKGLVTFKSQGPFMGHLVFARHWGYFLHKGSYEDCFKIYQANMPAHSYPLFVFSMGPNGDIARREDDGIFNDNKVEKGFDLFEISPGVWYLGYFYFQPHRAYFSGGDPKIALSPTAPSRAYLKILEAISILKIPLLPGETALEIGASPGGATYALLNQGLKVIGLDPGEMHPLCLEHPQFKNVKCSIQDVTREELRGMGPIDWLLVDMNLAPEAVLRELEKVIEVIGPNLKGGFLTLKMTKVQNIARMPFYQKLLKRMNLKVSEAISLPGHKKEFLVFVERW